MKSREALRDKNNEAVLSNGEFMAYEHVPLMYQQPYPPQGVRPLAVVGAPQGSPHCWGVQYNSEDRTCRNCDYQGTCRTEVIRKDLAARPVGVAPQPVPPPSYTTPPPPPRTIPVNYPPPSQQAYYVPQPQQTPGAVRYAPQATQPQAPQPLHSPPAQYGYGSTYDPMFYALAQVPEPFRPQVLGETFVERVAKNMFLAGIEAVLKEAVLGIRQLQWWPKPTSAAHQTVEVGR